MHVFDNKYLTTRKPHLCNGCERSFPAGTKMWTQRIANDGMIYNWRHCPTCDAIYNMGDYDEVMQGWVFDEMENGYESPEQYLAQLLEWRETASP